MFHVQTVSTNEHKCKDYAKITLCRFAFSGLFSRPEARQSQTRSADWQARASFNRQKTFTTKLNEGK